MKKKQPWGDSFVYLQKFFRIMRLTLILILMCSAMSYSAKSYSQNAKITLSMNHVAVKDVIKAIEAQSEFIFFYQDQNIDLTRDVSIEVIENNISEVLDQLFAATGNSYKINDRQIIIGQVKKKAESGENDPDAIAIPTEAQQKKSIAGIITDTKGQTMVGVTVVVKGTTVGTITDSEGKYSLQLPAQAKTLVISFVGMETAEISLGTQTNYNVQLRESAEMLGDIVVTGFQTIAKEKATGSYTKIKEEVISLKPTSNLGTALNGQVAGMTGEGGNFLIRGRGSFSGSTSPLLVVDGFPIEGGFGSINPNDVKSVDVLKDASATSIYGARASNGVIVVVTNNGSGAKGKVNVNYSNYFTMGGKIDLDYYMNMVDAKTQLDFEDSFWKTFSGTSVIQDPYTVSTGSFRGSRSPYSTLKFELAKGNITQEYFDKQRNLMLQGDYRPDVEKYLLRNYFAQQHNLQISGSSDRHSYKLSMLYDNDLSSYQNNNYNRVMVNLTNVYNLTKKIKYQFGVNINNSINKPNGVSMGVLKGSISPWTRLIDDEGNYTRMNGQNYEPIAKSWDPKLPYSTRYNVLEEVALRDNSSESLDIRIQNQFEIDLANGLKFTPMFQYEKNSATSNNVYDERSYASRNYADMVSVLDPVTNTYSSIIPKGGIYRKTGDTQRSSTKVRAQFDYTRTFKGKHSISALMGAEVISTVSDTDAPLLLFGYSPKGLNYASFDYKSSYTDIFQQTVLENSFSYEGANIYNYKASSFNQAYRYNERFLAAFFNASYSYDRRFTATISARTDASNYVAKSVRDKFSPFYSIGGLWNIHNEGFMKDSKLFDQLSLRASYGVTGLAAGKNSATAVTVFSSQPPVPETGSLPNGYLSGRDNDFLTWEKSYSSNLGIDFSMFNRKIYGNIDLYNKHSKDVMSSVQTSQVIQSTSNLNMNMGELLNRGIEVSLGADLKIANDFFWSGHLVFDYNYNETLKYDYLNSTLFYYLGSNRSAFIVGKPTDYLYMVKIVGTTKDGYYVQEKRNGELVVANNTSNSFSNTGRTTTAGITIDQDDRVWYMGRTTPPATASFTSKFRFKGFTLMTMMSGKFGHVFTNGKPFFPSVNSNSISASGFSILQTPSLVATDDVGNIYPNKINQTMWSELNSMRNYYSTAAVDKASFLRFNEIYLSYEFADKVLGPAKKYVKNLNLFTQTRNLGVLWVANKDGVDPEYLPGSIKPITVYTFGIKLNM